MNDSNDSQKQQTTVLNLRDMPLDLMVKVKAAAAFQRMSLKRYVTTLLEGHIAELERQGRLPNLALQQEGIWQYVPSLVPQTERKKGVERKTQGRGNRKS